MLIASIRSLCAIGMCTKYNHQQEDRQRSSTVTDRKAEGYLWVETFSTVTLLLTMQFTWTIGIP